jgi:uncharacterized protein YkwD
MRRFVIPSAALWLAVCVGSPGQDKKEPDKAEPTATEKAIVELINMERAKQKLPPLKINSILTKVARDHSQNMAKTGMLEHILDGKKPTDRVKASGYRPALCGENIAVSEGAYTSADVVQGWMDSKLHRENILMSRFTETGLGIFTNAKGETYYTQVFATPAR